MKINSLESTPQTSVSHNPAIKKKLLIAKGEIEHVTNFSQATFPPGEIANIHSHPDMTEVFFVQSGTGTITVNGDRINLEQGVCITIEPNDSHELNNTGSIELVVLYFGIQH